MTRSLKEEQVQYELEKRARHAVWNFASEYERVAMFSRPLFCTSSIDDLPLSYDLWPIMDSSLDSGTYYAGHLNFGVHIKRKTAKPLRFHKEFVVEYSRTFPLKEEDDDPKIEQRLKNYRNYRHELKYQVNKFSHTASPIRIGYSDLEEYEGCHKVQIRQQIPVTNNFVPRSAFWKEFTGFLGFRFDKNLYLLFNEHHRR